MAKKTRAHRKWANDCDYVAKLKGEALTWHEKFIGEYYQNDFEENPLHDSPRLRKDRYDADNAARADIMNAPPAEVRSHREAIPTHRPSIKSRFYFENDWSLNSTNPEDLLLEVIDENEKASSNVINLADYGRKYRQAS